MKRPHHPLYVLSLLLSLAVCAACSQDAYDKGEGKYSLLRADFVEAHATSDRHIDYVTTDEGERLEVVTPPTRSWIAQGDTLYRAICYYKSGEKSTIEIINLNQLNVVDSLMPADSLKKSMKTDPLTLESLWVSKNKRFLNGGIYLKSGSADDTEAVHRLGVVSDTLVTWPDGKRTLRTRLFHDQGGIPEYYSQRTYFSILLTGLDADSMQLSVNTYKGMVTKCLPIK